MTKTSFSRRHFLIGTAAAVAIGSLPAAALANSDALLADILVGVGDAMKRDWIREHYRRGHWDGRCWIYEGRRYSPLQYRDFWLSRYQAPPPPPRPAPQPHHPTPPPPAVHPGRGNGWGPHKDPGHPGKGPGSGHW